MKQEEKYKYECGNCKWQWLSDDYDVEVLPDNAYGYECPICMSDNISGYEVK
jgi:hypothetical protein